MSGWTILTVRGRASRDYEPAEYDGADPWTATADLAATMDADSRVRRWTTWSGHVYAYLTTSPGDFEAAERLLETYAPMVEDAVILCANNTSDQGTARYYDHPASGAAVHEYAETDNGMVGELALATMNARHEIIARDPFHNTCGQLDEEYRESGTAF